MIRIWGSFHTDICFVASQCFLQRGQYLRNEINHDYTCTQHDRVWCPHTCTYKCELNLRGPTALNFQSATAKFIQFYIYLLKEIWEGCNQILIFWNDLMSTYQASSWVSDSGSVNLSRHSFRVRSLERLLPSPMSAADAGSSRKSCHEKNN